MKMARGGRRPNAGRKPIGKRPGVPHRSREFFERLTPLHVTMRMAKHVWNLRSWRSFRKIEQALKKAKERFETRIIHFSIQGNHAHFIIECASTDRLHQAMKGLAVRIARRMNDLMRRKGQVIGDRYHSRVLRSERAAKTAIRYVRDNHLKHMTRSPPSWKLASDPFSSFGGLIELPAPHSRLLC
jgi:REP element-mobilizing transposase RayT